MAALLRFWTNCSRRAALWSIVGKWTCFQAPKRISIPLLRGEAFLDVGTYTVILATLPEDNEPQREATTTLNVLDSDQP